MKAITRSILVVVFALGLLNSQTTVAGQLTLVGQAACLLQPDPKSPLKVSGTIVIKDYNYTEHTREKQILQLSFSLSGYERYSNEKEHGFHVHEYGDISQGCGSTGAHYNPLGKSHGGSDRMEMRHIGDFGKIREEKFVRYWFYGLASLFGEHSIIGRSFVLHAGEDDLGKGGDAGSKATGNAGARLACCVIGWAKLDDE